MDNLFSEIHSQIFDPDRLPVAIMAILLVSCLGMVMGPLSGNANPAYWRLIDQLFGGLGGRMDRSGRRESDLMMRGFILTATALVISFLLGRFGAELAGHYPRWQLTEILMLSVVLTSGTVFVALNRLYKVLAKKEPLKGAFFVIASSTRTNLVERDDYTITRTAMAMAARSFDKGLVAPILWYLIVGLPGAFMYAGLAAMNWRFGKEGHSAGFGQSMLALEKLLGFVPNLFAGVLLAMAGIFTPTALMSRAFRGFLPGAAGQASYPEGGLAMSAMAWGLNVSLGGPTQDIDGTSIKRGWAGPPKATAQLGAKHLFRAMYLVGIGHILLLASLVGAIVVAGHGGFVGGFLAEWLDF